MLLNYLLLVSQGPADAVLDKFAQFAKNATSISVDLEVKYSGSSVNGAGTFQFARPQRIRFDLTWHTSHYEFIASEKGTLELDHGSRTYHEREAEAGLSAPDSTLSWIPGYAYPRALIVGDLRQLVPPGAAFRLISEQDGVHKVGCTFVSGMARATLTASIDASGKLLSMAVDNPEGERPGKTEVFFKNYAVDKSIPADRFSLKLPLGYSPEFLPAQPVPVNFGEEADLSGLARVGSKQVADLRKVYGSSPLLVVFAGADCAPTKRFLAFLSESRKAVEDRGGKVAVVWWGNTSTSPFDDYFDPKNEVHDRLFLPGTPTYFVVNAKGVVSQVWYGFDDSKPAQYRKELGEALDRAKSGE
jgi:hypothetical protein